MVIQALTGQFHTRLAWLLLLGMITCWLLL